MGDILLIPQIADHISPCSEISISRRPKAACWILLMQKSAEPWEFFWNDSTQKVDLHKNKNTDIKETP